MFHARAAHLAEAIARSLPGIDGGEKGNCHVCIFELSARTAEAQDAFLDALRRRAALAVLADWQNPERNLELPGAFLLHHAYMLSHRRQRAEREAFRAYLKRGALEGVLYRHRQRLRVRARASRWGGSLGLALVEWI